MKTIKSILITGGTGSLGKALTSHILARYPHIERLVIYSRDEQKQWLQHYFRARGMHQKIINDDLCDLVDQFSALAQLMWGLWALVQARVSQLDFDYVSYARLRLDCYKNLRPLLFEKE